MNPLPILPDVPDLLLSMITMLPTRSVLESCRDLLIYEVDAKMIFT